MPRPKSPVRLEWVDPAFCSLDYRLKIIARLPFFKGLPVDDIARINSLFHDEDALAGQWIYTEGSPASQLYLVATGKVKLLRSTPTGKDVLLDILHGGEYFGSLGSFSGPAYAESAVAQTDCCILKISITGFESILVAYPQVTRQVLEAVSQRLADSQEVIRQLSACPVEQRIAAALLRLARKLGEEREQAVLIQLPFSRQDLAAMTGSTTETVSRVMSHLSDAGYLQTGRKWVTLTNRSKLEELAKTGCS